jgi:DNA-binding SARP family transcriptional activator/Tfp pilus assembly protein PilF
MTGIDFLGGALVRRDGVPLTGPPSQRHRIALLALLAASWPHAVTRERAMALLWPESEAERARRLLNLAVHVLRRALGDAVIRSSGDGLLFDPAGLVCDVHAFSAARAANDPDTAASAYGGAFLDGFHLPAAQDFHYWLDEQRAQLARAYERALVDIASRQDAAGDVTGHVATCRRLAAADPYSGAYARTLVLALERAGERAAAVQHAHDHARRLRTELQLEPDAEIMAIAQRLQGSGLQPARRLAVLTEGGPAEAAGITAQLRDGLVGRLVRVPGVSVAALGSAGMRLLADAERPGPRVDAVVELSAQRLGDRLQLRLRMVDAREGVFLLSTRLEQAARSLDALLDDAGSAVEAALSACLPPSPVTAGSEYDLEEARILCAKGQHFCAKREESSLRRAIACFERARALAPAYAPAHAGLATAYAIAGFYDVMPPREAFSLAKQSAQTARALNPADPNVHASLGYIAKYFDWQWRAAEQELHDAVALDPSNATAHQWFGNYFVLRGRMPEAIASMKRAMRLAPHSAIAAAATGWAHYFSGMHDTAIEYYAESSELDAQLPMAHAWLGQTYSAMGRHDHAVAALRTAVALSPGSAAMEATLAHALAVGDARREATAILRRLAARRRREYVPSYEVAKVHLALGERSKAMHWLERAFRERSHSMGILRHDPQLRALHDEPRYQRLVTRVGHT